MWMAASAGDRPSRVRGIRRRNITAGEEKQRMNEFITSLLQAVITVVVSVLATFAVRFLHAKVDMVAAPAKQSAAKNGGKRWGKMDAHVGHVGDGFQEIRALMAAQKDSTEKEIERARRECKESVSRVHARVDEHLRAEHQFTIRHADKPATENPSEDIDGNSHDN